MKLILAIIRPEKLTAVQTALATHDVHLMTVSEVLGCGREQGFVEVYRGREVRKPAPKLRLEIAVPEPSVDAAVQAITRAAFTGQADDGEVLVLGLDDCVRSRWNQRPTAVLRP
jgi:nitrogen regulatory protein PII